MNFQKLPTETLDLRALIASSQLAATLQTVSLRMQLRAVEIALVLDTDPSAAAEQLRKLSNECLHALTTAAIAAEDEVRRRASQQPCEPIPNGRRQSPSAPKLFEPEPEAFTDPVGSGIIGTPMPQSDRTGA